MIQIVYTDLKSLIYKKLPKMRLNYITFREKIEGGSEAKRLFKVYKGMTPFRPPCRVHIMCEDKSKTFSLRPSRPAGRRSRGTFVDRPYVVIFFHLEAENISPE